MWTTLFKVNTFYKVVACPKCKIYNLYSLLIDFDKVVFNEKIFLCKQDLNLKADITHFIFYE